MAIVPIALISIVLAVIAIRLFLREVGRKALARIPSTAKLIRSPSPNWLNGSFIENQASPLKLQGFDDVGCFQLSTMPGVQLKILFHPSTSVAVHICEHPKAGSWTEMVTRYTDGRNILISNLRETGVAPPPWNMTTRVAPGTPTDQMFTQHIGERVQSNIKMMGPDDTVSEFENGYTRYMQWKNNVGMSAAEVVHVARKNAESKTR